MSHREHSVLTGTIRKHPWRDYAAHCTDVMAEGKAQSGHVKIALFNPRTHVVTEKQFPVANAVDAHLISLQTILNKEGFAT